MNNLKEIFIQKSILTHGSKYNYDKVDYINNKVKVLITCSIHGDFWQLPASHTHGANCQICAIENRKSDKYTQVDIINKFKEVHGDRYDYSKVVYNGVKSILTIICRKHGEYCSSYYDHLKFNCDKCAHELKANEKRKDVNDFINEANLTHNNKYDYSNVIYKNNKQKVDIICKEHGIFKQSPKAHLNGQRCPLCRYKSKGEEMIELYLKTNNINYKNPQIYSYSSSKSLIFI